MINELDNNFGIQFPSNPISSAFNQNILEMLCVTIMGIAFLSKLLMAYYSDLAILMHFLTLLNPVSKFITSLELTRYREIRTKHTKEHTKWEHWYMMVSASEAEKVLQQFNALKNLASLLTESIGLSLLFYIGETVTSYGLHTSSSLFNATLIVKIVVNLFYILTTVTMIISSEICRKACDTKNIMF